MSKRMKHRADCLSVRMVENQECANCGCPLCEECAPVFKGESYCSECIVITREAHQRKQALLNAFQRTHQSFLFALGGAA